MLASCNNVNPITEDTGRSLQASSPDEIAFVEFTDKLGYFMFNRKNDQLIFQDNNYDSKIDRYTILTCVPFRSETKKMRIFIKDDNDQIILMVKGAESEICKLVNNNESQWLNYKTKELSKKGLRTLAFCYKLIDKETYNTFKENYDKSYPDQKEQ